MVLRTMEVNGVQQTAWLRHSSKYLLVCSAEFLVNYFFKSIFMSFQTLYCNLKHIKNQFLPYTTGQSSSTGESVMKSVVLKKL